MGDAAVPPTTHALLAAELVDNAGWDVFIEIADEAGDRKVKPEFKKRLHEVPGRPAAAIAHFA